MVRVLIRKLYVPNTRRERSYINRYDRFHGAYFIRTYKYVGEDGVSWRTGQDDESALV